MKREDKISGLPNSASQVGGTPLSPLLAPFLYLAASGAFGLTGFLHLRFVSPRLAQMETAELLSLWPLLILLAAILLTVWAGAISTRQPPKAATIAIVGVGLASAYYLVFSYGLCFLLGPQLMETPLTIFAVLLPVLLIASVLAYSRKVLRSSAHYDLRSD